MINLYMELLVVDDIQKAETAVFLKDGYLEKQFQEDGKFLEHMEVQGLMFL